LLENFGIQHRGGGEGVQTALGRVVTEWKSVADYIRVLLVDNARNNAFSVDPDQVMASGVESDRKEGAELVLDKLGDIRDLLLDDDLLHNVNNCVTRRLFLRIGQVERRGRELE
jgi:hypothetical protein